jgi:ABC-2 type transport system ATP-binding protein
MAVQEYLLMMAALRSIPAADQTRLVGEAVEATGLGDYLIRQIGELSKGYRQRVGIAQAILHRPELLILDEPTSGLDPTQIAEIRQLIKDLSKHSTVMLSTHILSEVEVTCERVLMIIKGQLRADSSIEELRASQARNAALVTIEDGAPGVRETLLQIDGVKEVEAADETGGAPDGENVYRGTLIGDKKYRRWRVTSLSSEALCPAIFDALRGKGWKVAELRPEERSLEQVFRELTEPATTAKPAQSGQPAQKNKEVRA